VAAAVADSLPSVHYKDVEDTVVALREEFHFD
jgi:hypothetical protein